MNSDFNISDGLIVRYLCGEASVEEISAIEVLAQNDAAFARHLKEMQYLWEHSSMPVLDTEKDWSIICNRIGFKQKTSRSLFHYFARVAAVIVLVLSVSTALWVYWNVPGYGRWVVFETGAVSDSIVLPDASIVFLNRNSSLKYKNVFSAEERRVALKGEGYFEVSSDIEKPFRVEVGPVSVQVVGTAFNIDGRRKDGIVALNVTHGKVRLINNREKLDVKEGEWAIAGARSMGKGQIVNNNFLSWKTGLLEFRNSSLNEVVLALHGHFAEIEKIRIESSSDVLVTTRFEGQQLNEIIDELTVHFQKKFALHKGILIISD
jgi:transmembrane sensor